MQSLSFEAEYTGVDGEETTSGIDDASSNADDQGPDTEAPPGPISHPRSFPPPLPASASLIPAARAAADEGMAQRMLERLAASDYLGALIVAESLLEYRPLDSDASDTAQMARFELRRLYLERLGPLDAVPSMALPVEAILAHAWADARTGVVLARIDGVATIREIAEAPGMHATDALRILSELYLRRAIVVGE